MSRISWRSVPRLLLEDSGRASRPGRVTDIAPLAVFLASDESAWITGEVIRAAGGLVVAT
ncbi:MAG TPA: SDR family oxidoreductase [Candidatus Sulfotelmatobacter sp.]|nr:SDR family oxidoreductase [Candidatus Sulfotelmatobacter sp.]